MDALTHNPEMTFDIVLMGLLTSTMWVAFRLQRALGVLRRDRASLEQLVGSFNQATSQAEDGILRLQTTAQSTGRDIARHIEQARRLESDLQFLIMRAEKIADTVEGVVAPTRTHPDSGRPTQLSALVPAPSLSLTAKLSVQDEESGPRSKAERDLLMALRKVR